MELSWSSVADEIAPSTVLIVGFILFVIPEPASSTLGAGMLLLGAAWWFFEWGRP